jgi:hypothetical protein
MIMTKRNIIISLFIVGAVFFVHNLSLNRNFSVDEFEHVHASWKILHGERIYVDFYENHHPLFYYFLIPFISIFKESVLTIIAMREAIFLIFLLMLFVCYRVSLEVFGNKGSGLLGIFLLSTMFVFVNRVIEIRPDVPFTLFALLSILFFLKYFSWPRPVYITLSSLFAAVAFMFLQKAIFLILLEAGIILFDDIRNGRRIKMFLLYSAAFLLTMVPLLLPLSVSPVFRHYYLVNCWFINTKFMEHVPVSRYLFPSVAVNILIWCAWLLTLFLYKRTYQKTILFLLSAGLFLSHFMHDFPHYEQDYMLISPLIAIIAAEGITAVFKKKIYLELILLSVFSLYPFVSIVRAGQANIRNWNYTFRQFQLKRIAYVLSGTAGTDYVYDSYTQLTAFNLYRKDIDYIWFTIERDHGALITYQKYYNYNYDICALISKYKPRFISTLQVPLNDPRIADYYMPSAFEKDLWVRKE